MAKRNTARRQQEPKGPIQRMMERDEARKEAEPLVSPFTAKHGDYAQTTIAVTAGELEGEGHGQKRVTLNRGGSTVQRWIAAEALTQPQISAINLYSRVWHRVFTDPRVTANLCPVAFIRSTADEDEKRVAKLDAMETLQFLDERIFDIAPSYYRDVWQNIVLFDASAHEAGGNSRSSADRAKTICLFIADMIATILRL